MDDYTPRRFDRTKVIWLGIVAIFVVVGAISYQSWNRKVNQGIDGMVTIRGTFTCLPLKDKKATPEKKCELGLKSGEQFYALDITYIQDANTDLKAEDLIAVTGRLRPESEVPVTNWAKYDVDGVILVNTLLRTH